MDNSRLIKSYLEGRGKLVTDLAESGEIIRRTDNVVALILNCFNNNGKVLLCGNGGSAADAQHIASELSGKFYLERKPLFAEALHVNSSYLTAVANDISFDVIYSRLVEAKGVPGDILIALSTSGNSPNVINAARKAKEMAMMVVGFTGSSGGSLANETDLIIRIPSDDTPRIQEMHIILGHIICQLVEEKLFGHG